jgi:dolichyl-phosphate beta-glucosyltransferase
MTAISSNAPAEAATGRLQSSNSSNRSALIRDPIDLEIVIPAYNEQDRIVEAVMATTARLATLAMTARVVVVDNGSADLTAELVHDLQGLPVDVVVIGCSRAGKGAAVRRGVLTSRARYIGFCDADLATPVDAIDNAVALLQAGHKVVVGSRRCAGATYVVPQSRLRRAGSWVFRRAMRGVAGGVSDTQCGFKFFDAETAKMLFSRIRSDGFAFDVELVARAQAASISLIEMPVAWTDKAGSSMSPFRDGARIIGDMRAIRSLNLDYDEIS